VIRRICLSLVAGLAVSGATTSIARAAEALPDPVACKPACWRPRIGVTWQIQLTGRTDLSAHARLYELDAFDTPRRLVRGLHRLHRHAVCYVDAGTWEKWRPDAGRYPRSVLGRSNGWPGERWLDVRRLKVLAPILRARLDMCRRKGFDGAELDNVDGYANLTGFPISFREQLRFNVFLANAAHRRGLAVALKNDLGQVDRLLPYFDWSLDEQCFEFRECRRLRPFIRHGKPVLEIEYRLRRADFCARAGGYRFSAMRKHRDLDAYRRPCG
jgi:hypothetical protein